MNKELYSIVALEGEKLVSSYGKLYSDKREVALQVVKLLIKEHETLLDSIDREQLMEDAVEDRELADKAMEDFFFDSGFGTKLYMSGDESKYYIPKRFQILTLTHIEDKK